MPHEISVRHQAPVEWWERLLTCGFLFHEFECDAESTDDVRSFRCKKCGHVSIYRQARSLDGAPQWEKVDVSDYKFTKWDQAASPRQSQTH